MTPESKPREWTLEYSDCIGATWSGPSVFDAIVVVPKSALVEAQEEIAVLNKYFHEEIARLQAGLTEEMRTSYVKLLQKANESIESENKRLREALVKLCVRAGIEKLNPEWIKEARAALGEK